TNYIYTLSLHDALPIFYYFFRKFSHKFIVKSLPIAQSVTFQIICQERHKDQLNQLFISFLPFRRNRDAVFVFDKILVDRKFDSGHFLPVMIGDRRVNIFVLMDQCVDQWKGIYFIQPFYGKKYMYMPDM